MKHRRTSEQIAYSNDKMIKRVHKKKAAEKPIFQLPEMEQNIIYMNNCVWWIEHFNKGETDIDRLDTVTQSLKELIKRVRIINKLTP